MDVVFQTYFGQKSSNALREFAVLASLLYLQAIRQPVEIGSVRFLTMGHVLWREVVSASMQAVDVLLGTCGCAFQQVGLILERKTWTCFNLKLIWQRVGMVLGRSAFDPEAHVF